MEPATELKMTEAMAAGQEEVEPASTDHCCDDGLCTCGKPIRPSVRKVLTYFLGALVTHVGLCQVASLVQISVVTMAAFVVPSLVSEDVYDDWDGFEEEAEQSPLFALTNATCPVRDIGGVPGKVSALDSAKFVLVFFLTEMATTAVFVAIRNVMESCTARLRRLVPALF